MERPDLRSAGLWLGIAIACAVAAFAIAPQIDLEVSAWFYDPRTGFWMARLAWLESFRQLVWNLSIMMFVLSLAGLGFAWAKKPLLSLGARDWGYVSALFLLGPVLLVNIILKQHWGRARPADVTQFGGAHDFTPPWQPADQCVSNCSFVSGEVSGAVVLAVALMMLRPVVAQYFPRWGRKIWTMLSLSLPLAIMVQRVVTGRHFLSDTLFAALFMLALAVVLRRLMWRRG